MHEEDHRRRTSYAEVAGGAGASGGSKRKSKEEEGRRYRWRKERAERAFELEKEAEERRPADKGKRGNKSEVTSECLARARATRVRGNFGEGR